MKEAIFRQNVGIKERKGGGSREEEKQKGESRTGQGKKTIGSLKTEMIAIHHLSPLPHPTLYKVPQVSFYLCKLCGCVIYPVSDTL